METNDFVSLLGITSGVSATLVLICIAIGLTARFRQRTSGQNRPLATSVAAAGAPVSVASPTGDGHWSKKVNGNQRRRPASHLNLDDLKINAEDDENDNPDVIPERNNVSRLVQEADRLTPTHADPLSVAAEDRLDDDDTTNSRRTVHRTNQSRPAYQTATLNRTAPLSSSSHRHDYRYHAVETPPQTSPAQEDRWQRHPSPNGAPWPNGGVHFYQTLPHKKLIGAPPVSRNPIEVVTRKTLASDDPETSI